MRAMLLTLLLGLVAVAGCLGNDDRQECLDCEATGVPEEARQARVVVAVIDSGTTPYHEHFQREGGIPGHHLDSFVNSIDGSTPERIHLTQEGDFEARFEADKGVWDGMEQERLYHFEGTALLGISFGSTVPVLDDGGSSHGTATTGSVLDANPKAIVLLVEGDYARAEAWVAEQDWIDIVSMSYGPPGSVPGSAAAMGLETHTHTKAMWAAGQVPVGAADNTPSLAPNDETAGPPWVVGVAGDHPEDQCREHRSGSLPDFTADFTQELPRAYSTDEYGVTSGTSFSTPMTAGTFSRVLLEVRQSWGHTGGLHGGVLAHGPDGQNLTNTDLRAAFERTATYFGADCGGLAPVNPVLPAAQQGWGHIGPDLVNATAAHILGLEEAPAKDSTTQAFMGAQYTYRETLWGTLP